MPVKTATTGSRPSADRSIDASDCGHSRHPTSFPSGPGIETSSRRIPAAVRASRCSRRAEAHSRSRSLVRFIIGDIAIRYRRQASAWAPAAAASSPSRRHACGHCRNSRIRLSSTSSRPGARPHACTAARSRGGSSLSRAPRSMARCHTRTPMRCAMRAIHSGGRGGTCASAAVVVTSPSDSIEPATRFLPTASYRCTMRRGARTQQLGAEDIIAGGPPTRPPADMWNRCGQPVGAGVNVWGEGYRCLAPGKEVTERRLSHST